MSDENESRAPAKGALKWVAVALAGSLAGGTAVWVATSDKTESRSTPGPVVGITQTPGAGDGSESAGFPVLNQAAPALVLDVASPAKLRTAMLSNAWVDEVLAAPLGRGFLGSWAGFLGTRGTDIGGVFAGTLLEFMLDRVLSTPFRVVWFGGSDAPSSPVIVVPQAGGTAKAAFEAIDKIARRGTVNAAGCRTTNEPGDEPVSVDVARWLVADHPVFAAVSGAQLFFSRDVAAVVQASCVSLGKAESDADLALSVFPSGLGREAEQLALLTGLTAPRLEFMLENNVLVPRGIAGQALDGRLSSQALPESMLKAIPEDVPVVMALGLNLPTTLDAESIAAHFKKPNGKLARHAVLLWVPRGGNQGVETALLWSRPEDRAELQAMFNQALDDVCGVPALSSSDALTARMRRSCMGQAPSVMNAAPAVSEGFRKFTSVALGVHPGRALSGLTVDAYQAETGDRTLPSQMEDARKLLDELPFVGLFGRVKGSLLVPGGFRS